MPEFVVSPINDCASLVSLPIGGLFAKETAICFPDPQGDWKPPVSDRGNK